LRGEVAGHGVDGVGEILPGTGDAGDESLTTEFAVGADFASDAGDFGGEGAQLVHHRVDGFLKLEDFTAYVGGNFAREVAAGDGGVHVGVATDLGGEVAGHGVDGVGEILPGAGDAGDLCLAAELAFGADFAGNAGDFGSENAELLNHGVDDVG